VSRTCVPQPAARPGTRALPGPAADSPPRDWREPLPGALFRARLGRLAAAVVECGPADRRGGRLPDGPLFLCCVVRGAARVEQDGRQAIAGAGTLTMLDSTRPYRVVVPRQARVVVLAVPHALVGLSPRATAGVTTEPWPGARGGAGAPLYHVLAGLDRSVAHLAPATAEQIGSGIAGLVGAVLVERLRPATGGDAAAPRHALLLRIQSYARRHLADPDLRPAELARRHNISLRYQQKLFHEQGLSPASWIRDERLARCRAELHDPRLAHLSVAAIGERSGLRGASYFGRLFRERYGVSPGAFRRSPAPDAPAAGPAAPAA
jgi:AraC-like DNA-binding protein